MATHRPFLQPAGRALPDFGEDRLYTVTFEAGWNAEAAPDGWFNNETAATGCVKNFMKQFNGGSPGNSLVRIYNDGFRLPHVMKGFHQKERMHSFTTGITSEFCHLTVRLYKVPRYYRAVHLYFTNKGHLVGSTLWDERTNQAIS